MNATAFRALRGIVTLFLLLLSASMLSAQAPSRVQPSPAVENGAGEDLQVYAHRLEHRSTRFVIDHLRPLLSPRGTVEEQPQHNNLIVRDTATALRRIRPLIARLDTPLRNLRLDIQVIEAGPRRPSVISPVVPPSEGEGPVIDERLPADFAERILPLLRYDEYRVLAQAGMSSKEGENVVYNLGDGYSVSFRVGSVVSEKRLQLQGFRVFKQNAAPNKGRRIAPEADDLFQGTLNLWTDRPFTLVLTQDKKRQEALMVAISISTKQDSEVVGSQEEISEPTPEWTDPATDPKTDPEN